MSTDIVQVNFRMPAALKERLEAASIENRRTLTAEIIARLEASFSLLPKIERMAERDDEVSRKLAELTNDLNAFMVVSGKDPEQIRRLWEEVQEDRAKARKATTTD